jgi:DNA-binding HxlR family transcriptional regulator
MSSTGNAKGSAKGNAKGVKGNAKGIAKGNAKEVPPIHQLLGLLEARYAIRVLWALRDGHAQTFRLLQDSVGGITPNTLNTRIKELREAGLVHHASDGYAVTTTGSELLKRLADLPTFASKWVASQARKRQA